MRERHPHARARGPAGHSPWHLSGYRRRVRRSPRPSRSPRAQFRQTLVFRRDEVPRILPLDERIRARVGRMWPGVFCGRCACSPSHPRGFPLLFFRFGDINPRAMMASMSEAEFRSFFIHWMELSLRHVASCNAPGTPSCNVAAMVEVHDLKGLRFSQLYMPGLRMLARVLALGQAHYPENLHRCVIIHAPTIFAIAWRVIGAVLNERTRAKITVLADDGVECLTEVM
jgi:hypothetical protein